MALISLTEAASRAGISRSTVESLMKRGQFIAVYQLPTGSLRFDDHELDQWLRSCRRTAPSPRNQPAATGTTYCPGDCKEARS